MKVIRVVHQSDDVKKVDVFRCEYETVGDYSISWRGQEVSLSMKSGHNEDDEMVAFKYYAKAWSVEVLNA